MPAVLPRQYARLFDKAALIAADLGDSNAVSHQRRALEFAFKANLPSLNPYTLRLAAIHMQLGCYMEAKSVLEDFTNQEVMQSEHSAEALLYMGLVHLLQDRFEEAE